jgi:hypothetical protein
VKDDSTWRLVPKKFIYDKQVKRNRGASMQTILTWEYISMDFLALYLHLDRAKRLGYTVSLSYVDVDG